MKKNSWLKYTDKNITELNKICDNYKEFLSNNKTERECVDTIINLVESKGFKNLDNLINSNTKIKCGEKIYVNNKNKALALFVIGKDIINDGINILGAHIDSPRIDIRSNPIYEEEGFTYFDTHYYGGIKKYQWVTLPLALHGVIIKKDLEKINIKIGEDKDDPVFSITDLLPHLAKNQMDKEARKVIEGEKLDILIGSKPMDEEKESIKKNILNILNKKYDIIEEDFLSAELEVVPAGKARDLGLDKSMIIGYGQDDRVCAYTSLTAFLDCPNTDKTISCILVDKEEIGSVGATGMHSKFYENAISEICLLLGFDSSVSVGRVLNNSRMLSSDVNAAYDPLYSDVMDKNNSSYFGRGIAFCKFTGSGGKTGSNDANAEYIAKLRKILDENNTSYQFSELGKVDVGGGGTIAYILANQNVEVIDSGIAVLNMHAPWEITSKADIYEAYKGYKTFLTKC
ncbi:MAG: aminopeptidase [Bacilli bacterium]|nr:aminopeptidase [Bacilli bacterium]